MLVLTEARSSSTGDAVDFHHSSHSAALLAALQELRLDRQFADVILHVEDKDFYCHRNVLTASSAYFRSMFLNNMKESRESRVVIKGVTSTSMELVLDYVYTSRVTITTGNVQGLLSAADLLQVVPVQRACELFLWSHIHTTNCLGVYLLAEQHSCKELSHKAWSYALENFPRVCCHGEILKQSAATLVKYLSSDELVVESEEDVCETILKWTLTNLGQRRRHLHVLLALLRTHLLPRKYLTERVLTNELITGSIDANKLLSSSYGGSEIFISSRLGERRTRSRKVIVVVGGVGPANTKLRDLKYYDPVDRRWGTLTQLPAMAESVSGVEVVDSNIYVVGFRGEVSVFRTASSRWETLSSSAVEAGSRQRRAAAVLSGFIYLVGGYDGAIRLSRVDRFDTRTKVWEEVAPLSEAVSSPAAVSHDGKVYVFGGALSDEIATDKVRCYDPKFNRWLTCAPMPHALSGIAARVMGDKIYIVGCLSQTVHRYDPATDTWGQVTSMRCTRALCSAAVCDDKLYVNGGEDQPNSLTDTMEQYDPISNRWTPCYSLPYPVKLHNCVTLIKRI
ncbi:kelch-like protein 24 [Acanthaster planci]|uniref:Kelch-like protein 24 n=1 Tax=Acanthaster planci TaxID=133434 RepID=A0A8B7ZJS4_ACAPL|nr:kelch-like protein 24 [Acanthaster planci]XP_022105277.1 kelch-like protein 24 [Acanthaster planci]